MSAQKSIAFAIIMLCSFKLSAQQGVDQISFGKGLLNYVAEDSSFSVKFAPRFQVRYYGTSDFTDDGLARVDHDFLVRRSRFKFDGWAVHPSIGTKWNLVFLTTICQVLMHSLKMLRDIFLMQSLNGSSHRVSNSGRVKQNFPAMLSV